jgi:hypothetical protein
VRCSSSPNLSHGYRHEVWQNILPKLQALVVTGHKLGLEHEDLERTDARKDEIEEFYEVLVAQGPSFETMPSIRDVYGLPSVKPLLEDNQKPISTNMWYDSLDRILPDIHQHQITVRRGLVDLAEASGSFPEFFEMKESRTGQRALLRTDEVNNGFIQRAIVIFQLKDRIMSRPFVYPSMIQEHAQWFSEENERGFSPVDFEVYDSTILHAKAILKSLNIADDVTREELDTSIPLLALST